MTTYVRRDDPETSKESAAIMTATGYDNAVEAAIGECLEAAGEKGLTTWEIAEQTGIARVTISPRLRPMARKGQVSDAKDPVTGKDRTRIPPGATRRSKVFILSKFAA